MATSKKAAPKKAAPSKKSAQSATTAAAAPAPAATRSTEAATVVRIGQSVQYKAGERDTELYRKDADNTYAAIIVAIHKNGTVDLRILHNITNLGDRMPLRTDVAATSWQSA